MQENPQVSTTPPLPGIDLVTQVNGALQTIATNFSGDTDPAAVAWPYALWADTANGRIKRRNAAGTAWVDAGPLFPAGAGMLRSVQYFTAAGAAQYIKPSWLTFAVVEVQAGGGGGGRAQGGTSGAAEGAGGGGGGYSRKLILASDLSADEDVTVGAAGSGGVTPESPNGTNGGSSSFGAHHSATGGIGGAGGLNTTSNTLVSGGLPGTGVGGDLVLSGGRGGNGRVLTGSAVTANYGGSSQFAGTMTGTAGSNRYGGGGGGGVASPTAASGQDGGSGIVVVWEYA